MLAKLNPNSFSISPSRLGNPKASQPIISSKNPGMLIFPLVIIPMIKSSFSLWFMYCIFSSALYSTMQLELSKSIPQSKGTKLAIASMSTCPCKQCPTNLTISMSAWSSVSESSLPKVAILSCSVYILLPPIFKYSVDCP